MSLQAVLAPPLYLAEFSHHWRTVELFNTRELPRPPKAEVGQHKVNRATTVIVSFVCRFIP